jgi:uncharacterized membrane protein
MRISCCPRQQRREHHHARRDERRRPERRHDQGLRVLYSPYSPMLLSMYRLIELETDVKTKERPDVVLITSNNQQKASNRREIIRSLKAEADANRTWSDRFADRITSLTGSMPFLVINAAWFVIWIIINLGIIPGIEPFDPFPFGLLTMVVSLEAIILAIAVLISQNRAAKVDDLREEVGLQVNVIAEHELTRIMEMIMRLLEAQGIDVSDDEELQHMLKPTDVKELEQIVADQIADSHKSTTGAAPHP